MHRVQWPDQVVQTQALKEIAREVSRTARMPGSSLAVIGQCGTGKTVAVFYSLSQLGPKFKPVVIQTPEKENLSPSAIMAAMVRELSGEEPRRDMEARTHQFRRVLGEATQNHRVVLVIDEAHALSPRTLRSLKRMLELGFGARMGGLFSVVMLAQPEMWAKLRACREANLRTRKVQMRTLTPNEAADLVKQAAAAEGLKVQDGAVKLLAQRLMTPLDIASTVAELKAWTEDMGEDQLTEAMVTVFVGDGLRQTMERYGIRNADLAKESGLSTSVVSQTLAGKYPGRDKLAELNSTLQRIVREKEKVSA